MKINVNYARRAGRESHGSENLSLAIETEPPPEVAQDREKLRAHVEHLFEEAKTRVEVDVGAVPPVRVLLAAAHRTRRNPGKDRPRDRRAGRLDAADARAEADLPELDADGVARRVEGPLQELVVGIERRHDLLHEKGIEVLPAVPPLDEVDGGGVVLPHAELVRDAAVGLGVRSTLRRERIEAPARTLLVLALEGDDVDELPPLRYIRCRHDTDPPLWFVGCAGSIDVATAAPCRG
ncbi:MAG: hypothetical protein IT460_06795 [Planctomycetes bacterium]|nr:hypothetical protein [Planctomycetota bacterium]